MDIIREISIHAKENPSRIAFHFRSGSITYGELWEKSGRLAAWISKQSLAKGQPIPVYGHKNIYMWTAFIACVRAGHAYVPMDTNMPAERIRDIACTVNSPLIFATEPLNILDTTEVIDLLRIKDILQNEPALVNDTLRNKKNDTHYIIFTSGSTGKPKGVMITTGSLENYLDWSVTLINRKAGVFLNQAPFSFDLSVMDTYTGLATGSTIWSVDHDLLRDMKMLINYMKEGKINYFVSTPSFADLCLSSDLFCESTLEELNTFLFCGETLTVPTARKLRERFPEARIINTYGPTETTVCVTSTEITDKMLSEGQNLPVGKAKPGTYIYAVAENEERLPAGVEGELIIAGNTTAAGYYKNDTQTLKRFFTNSERLKAYRTGDFGYVNEDGMVYYKCRMDNQIKFHGYRIELGDIENNLQALNGISNAAVFPELKDGAIHSLAAYIVQNNDDTSYARRKFIRDELRKKLPSYMVPKKINFMSEFPMTLNGKIDRKRLKETVNAAVC